MKGFGKKDRPGFVMAGRSLTQLAAELDLPLTQAAVLYKVGVLWRYANHRRKGDPLPWVARPLEEWLDDCALTRHQWDRAVPRLVAGGWPERAKGLRGGLIASLLRPAPKLLEPISAPPVTRKSGSSIHKGSVKGSDKGSEKCRSTSSRGSSLNVFGEAGRGPQEKVDESMKAKDLAETVAEKYAADFSTLEEAVAAAEQLPPVDALRLVWRVGMKLRKQFVGVWSPKQIKLAKRLDDLLRQEGVPPAAALAEAMRSWSSFRSWAKDNTDEGWKLKDSPTLTELVCCPDALGGWWVQVEAEKTRPSTPKPVWSKPAETPPTPPFVHTSAQPTQLPKAERQPYAPAIDPSRVRAKGRRGTLTLKDED